MCGARLRHGHILNKIDQFQRKRADGRAIRSLQRTRVDAHSGDGRRTRQMCGHGEGH